MKKEAYDKFISNVKHRKEPNDRFYTPKEMAEWHVDEITSYIGVYDVIYEPFAGKGVYRDVLKDKFRWQTILDTEIDEGTDFFDFTDGCNVIISNPPYSCIDAVLEKSLSLNPRIISYLLGSLNLTLRRIKFMESKGYHIAKMSMARCSDWIGTSQIITWIKDWKEKPELTWHLENFSHPVVYFDCPVCGVTIKSNNAKLHCKSARHLLKSSSLSCSDTGLNAVKKHPEHSSTS